MSLVSLFSFPFFSLFFSYGSAHHLLGEFGGVAWHQHKQVFKIFNSITSYRSKIGWVWEWECGGGGWEGCAVGV